MDPRYRLTTLPLDTPDDDPRWRSLVEAIRLGFLEGRDAAEETVSHNRDGAREAGSRIRVVELVDRGQAPDQPVATLVSFDGQVNVGGGRQLVANLVSDVTVRTTHRRRGLLREMMTVDLREAKERGCALASLTASEATIYGRFGFGIATRRVRIEVDARRWQLREPVVGTCEYLDASATEVALRELLGTAQKRLRGAHGGTTERPWIQHVPDYLLGRYDWESEGVDKKKRQMVHLADDGSVDGIVAYSISNEDRSTVAFVEAALAADDAVYLALWDAVVHLDLVDKVRGWVPWNSPLPWAVTDYRATSSDRRQDLGWLRVLDVPAALQARGWEADGSVVLDVVDPMELAGGRWRLEVTSGTARLTPTDEEPDVWLDVETLGSLYLGDLPVATMAAAGRVRGSVEGVRGLGRLMATGDVVDMPFGF